MLAPINNISSGSSTELESRVPQKTLSQQDFLKLLITQLTNQDPLSPNKDTEFIAQMATFSVLSQTQQLVEILYRLEASQQTARLVMLGSSVLGKQIEITTKDGTHIVGQVEQMAWDGGVPSLVVDGKMYGLANIEELKIYS